VACCATAIHNQVQRRDGATLERGPRRGPSAAASHRGNGRFQNSTVVTRDRVSKRPGSFRTVGMVRISTPLRIAWSEDVARQIYLQNLHKEYLHGCVETGDSLYNLRARSQQRRNGDRRARTLHHRHTSRSNQAMKSAAAWVAALSVIGATATASSRECNLRLEGVRDHYKATDTVVITLVNVCAQQISVNVVLETAAGKDWEEAIASVSDRRHPFGKVIELTRIKAGARVNIRYQPGPKSGPPLPEMFTRFPVTARFRVDMYDPDGAIRPITSDPFTITSDDGRSSPPSIRGRRASLEGNGSLDTETFRRGK
jgi:hypothetical protein